MSTTKLQVPMDADLAKGLKARANKLGFDSIQAYIRFWARAEVDGRRVTFGEDDWGEPSDAAAERINRAAEEAKQGINVSKPFTDPEEFMKALRK